MASKSKIHQIGQDLVNEMFRIAGYAVCYDDVKDDTSEWYLKYTMTEEENEAWRAWGVKLIRKKLRMTEKRAQSEMAMFDLCFGLRIQNEKDGNL